MSGAPFTNKPVEHGEAAIDEEDLWQYQFADLVDDGTEDAKRQSIDAGEPTQADLDESSNVGDDGPGTATDVSEEDRHLLALDKAHQDAAEMRNSLKPSAFGFFCDLDRQLDAHARAQLAAPGRCLVHVSDPTDSGETTPSVPGAVDTLLQTYAMPRSDDPARAWTSMTTFTTGRKAGVHHAVLDTVSALFILNRVVAVYETASDVSLREMSDVKLEVRPFDAPALAAALAHAFRPALADRPAQITSDAVDSEADADSATRQKVKVSAAAAAERLAQECDLSRLTPSEIDFACSKAASIGEAETLLARVLSAPAGRVETFDRTNSPTLEKLPGYESVRSWAEALVRDVKDYAAGKLAWADIDVGALLTGPPGTGKTLLAGAIARSAGCTFISTSVAEWLAGDGGHLGSVVAAMRKAFADATRTSPCILFIDEFDSLPGRGMSGRHDDYWRPVVNALLELLDGEQRRDGLIVLAACNDPSRVDPALLRSGRLDRTVLVDMPTLRDLAEIFRHMVPDLDVDDADRLAAVLVGSTTGADVARLAREARGRARREGRPVSPRDILAIALPPDTRSMAVRRRVAVHEAGHAVGYMLAGRMPATISIRPGNHAGAGGWLAVPRDYQTEGRRNEVELAELVPLLCGRAAEEIILGEASSGAGGPATSDLARATKLASAMIGRFGLERSLVYADNVDGVGVPGVLNRCYAQALFWMLQHRQSIHRLVELLLAEQVVGRTAILEFARYEGLTRNGASEAVGNALHDGSAGN